jgi:hypothetical protein
MRMTLVCIQVRCEQPEGPEGNVSRYTVRPGTPGSTLPVPGTNAIEIMRKLRYLQRL